MARFGRTQPPKPLTQIFRIVAAAGGSAIKTFNGLLYASTKTFNGVALASVKTRNGLA